jgi:hypothetical protein
VTHERGRGLCRGRTREHRVLVEPVGRGRPRSVQRRHRPLELLLAWDRATASCGGDRVVRCRSCGQASRAKQRTAHRPATYTVRAAGLGATGSDERPTARNGRRGARLGAAGSLRDSRSCTSDERSVYKLARLITADPEYAEAAPVDAFVQVWYEARASSAGPVAGNRVDPRTWPAAVPGRRGPLPGCSSSQPVSSSATHST